MIDLSFEHFNIEEGPLIYISVELGYWLPLQIAHSFSNLKTSDAGLQSNNELHIEYNVLALFLVQVV